MELLEQAARRPQLADAMKQKPSRVLR